jgi:hypothetical protein
VTLIKPLDRGNWAFAFTVLACLWGIGLIVAAVLVPVYSSQTVSLDGGTTASSSSTLVEVNGAGVLIPVSVPAAVAFLVWIALRRKCTRGGRISAYVAWSLIGILFALSVLAILSIGLFILPVAGLLAGAAGLTPFGRPGALRYHRRPS